MNCEKQTIFVDIFVIIELYVRHLIQYFPSILAKYFHDLETISKGSSTNHVVNEGGRHQLQRITTKNDRKGPIRRTYFVNYCTLHTCIQEFDLHFCPWRVPRLFALGSSFFLVKTNIVMAPFDRFCDGIGHRSTRIVRNIVLRN